MLTIVGIILATGGAFGLGWFIGCHFGEMHMLKKSMFNDANRRFLIAKLMELEQRRITELQKICKTSEG